MNPLFGFETVLMGQAFPPNAGAAGTITGITIDRIDYQGDLSVLVNHGVVTGSPTAFSVNAHVEESEDSSTWTDVDLAADIADGGDAITEMSDDSSTYGVETLRIKLENRKRYLRVVCVVAFTDGSSPKVPVAGFYTLSGCRRTIPVTQP
jgi:hypothetical protein